MKKLLLIIAILFIYTVQAQNQYRLKLYGELFYSDPSYPLITNGSGFIDSSGIESISVFSEDNTLLYSDGNIIGQDGVYANPTNTNTPNDVTFILDDYIIDLPQKPHRVLFYITADQNVGAPGDYESSICDADPFILILQPDQLDIKAQSTLDNDCFTDVHLEAAAIPLLNTVKDICVNDMLFEVDPANPSTSISGLSWYYFDVSDQTAPFDYYWENVQEFSNEYPLNRTINEVLPGDYPGSTGVNVKLRIGYKPLGYTMSRFYSDTAFIDISGCSPEITNFTSTDTTCSNSSDGSFTITFDRDLEPGELLTTVSLYHDGPDTIFNNGNDVLVTTLTNQTYTGMTYTWPNPLPADQYRLEYQSGGDNSLVEYSPILINAPTPVTFTATWTNVDCFGENTGSISIVASGGSGSYQYSIDNGSNWNSFSSATSHLESNLIADDYQVKVRDSFGCVAQM